MCRNAGAHECDAVVTITGQGGVDMQPNTFDSKQETVWVEQSPPRKLLEGAVAEDEMFGGKVAK